MQYSEEEQQYLLLRSQFNNELATINAQIEDLTARKEHIEALLALDDVEVNVEFTPDENVDLRVIDVDLIEYLEDHPGSRRAEINAGLETQGWTPSEVEKSLKRCRNAGKIRREGQTRTAVWFAKEES